MAVVMGAALCDGADNEPSTDIDLYLAEVSEAVEGGISLAKLDAGSSPKATLHGTGSFVFNEVPPGKYALAVYVSPAHSALVSDPETGKELVISVEAGDVLSVGTVYVPSL